MPDREQLEKDFKVSFQRLCDCRAIVYLPLQAVDAWAVFCNLQLALRHPENHGPTSEIARGVALQLQEMITVGDPTLSAVAMMGWDAQFDQPVEDQDATRTKRLQPHSRPGK